MCLGRWKAEKGIKEKIEVARREFPQITASGSMKLTDAELTQRTAPGDERTTFWKQVETRRQEIEGAMSSSSNGPCVPFEEQSLERRALELRMTTEVFKRWTAIMAVVSEYAKRLDLKYRVETSLLAFPDIMALRRMRLDFVEKQVERKKAKDRPAAPVITVAAGATYVAPGGAIYGALPAANAPMSPAPESDPLGLASTLGQAMSTATPAEREEIIRRLMGPPPGSD